MSQTIIAFGDSKAVKRWQGLLANDTLTKAYFSRKFIGTGQNNIIEQKDDLESDAGDTIQYDLSVQLRGTPTSGDARLEGREESLRFYSDTVKIDQLRHSVSAGGKMSRKRTAHDLRTTAKDRLSDYWAMYLDQMMFMYLSGSRGINQDYYEPLTYTGHANNALTAPDASHLIYGGAATSKATLTAADKMTRNLVEKVVTQISMLRAVNPNAQNMVPVTMNGEDRYVLLMSNYQEYQLRVETGAAGWLELNKAAAAANGDNNRIFKGALGMINNVILHSHQSVIRFNDYGAGGNVAAARALFMGRQAGVVGYGTPGGQKMTWKERMVDYDNEPTVAAGMIIGIKKTTYNGMDFGVAAVDTAADVPV